MDNLEYNKMLFNKSRDRIIENYKKIKNSNRFYDEFLRDVGEIKDYEDFYNLPILTKQTFVENAYIFHEKVMNKENAECYSTSGTSGVPLRIIRDKEDDVQQNLILNFYRTRNCRKIIGKKGVHFVYFFKEDFEENYEVLYYNEHFERYCYFILNDTLLQQALSYIEDTRPSWITGSASFILKLAQYKLEHNVYSFQLDYIECNSEYLSDYARGIIFEAFNVMPTCVYGSNEHNAIAYECKNGKFHVLDQSVFVEIMKDRSVIITSLLNKQTGLLRYEQGDLADWEFTECNCGCSGPIIKLTGFRKNDCIVNGDVSVDMWFFHGIIQRYQRKYDVVIDQYRVVQEGKTIYISIIVKNPNEFPYKKELIDSVNIQFDKIFGGDLECIVTFIDTVEVDQKNGKFRYFIRK